MRHPICQCLVGYAPLNGDNISGIGQICFIPLRRALGGFAIPTYLKGSAGRTNISLFHRLNPNQGFFLLST